MYNTRQLESKTHELQEAFKRHNSKASYDGLKGVFGPRVSKVAPLRSADGETILHDHKEILDHWAERFNTILNKPSAISQAVTDNIKELLVCPSMAVSPSDAEIRTAIRKLPMVRRLVLTEYLQRF